MSVRWFDLITTHVAGTRHHLSQPQLRELLHGTPLILVREPDNAYDANAVRIDRSLQKCGYVPAALSPIVAALMDHGYELRCSVDYVDERQHALIVSLRMIDVSDV